MMVHATESFKINSTIQKVLFFLILNVLGALNSQSANANANCRELIASYTKNQVQKIVNYYRQFKDTNKVFLFLKNAPEKKSAIFFPDVSELEKYSRTTNIFQYFPKKISHFLTGTYHHFTPLQGISYLIYDFPFRTTTNRFLHRELVPRAYITMPTSILASIAIYSKVIDPTYQKDIIDNINKKTLKNSERLDTLIENDFRYNEIKKELLDHKIEQQTARTKAYWKLLALSEYYQFLIRVDQSFEEYTVEKKELKIQELNQDVFSKHLLFTEVNHLANSIIPNQRVGFFIPPGATGPLSSQKKELLFKNEHAKLLKMETTAQLFQNKPEGNNPTAKMEVFNHPFYQKLLNSKLPPHKIMNLIQEHISWTAQFNTWKILGVKKYRVNENDELSSDFLSIRDIEEEIQSDL